MSGFHVEPFLFEPIYPEGQESVSSESEEEELSVDREREGNTDWCVCENCFAMPTSVESVCCQELDVLNEKFDLSGVDCITEHHKFEIVCLDTDVLSTALVAIHNARCTPKPETIENRAWRLAAYRQFTWWAHGYLGKKIRRPIPSCVVKVVRDRFPEESGDYTGFQECEFTLDNTQD